MTAQQPYPTPGTFTSKQGRLAQTALLARGGTAIQGRTGIVGVAGFAVTQTGSPSMGVSIAAGQLALQGSGADQGTYLCTLDAATTVTIATAPASNTRIDLIYAQVTDVTDGTGAGYTLVLNKVTGTAAASPSVPATPTDAVALAQVLVGTSVSTIVNANITDKRVYTAALGGVIPCTSATRPSHGTALPIWESDTGLLQISTGAAWTRINTTAPSWTSITLSGSFASHGAPYSTPAWWKDAITGIVRLRGVIDVSGSQVVNTTAFTLPSGSRPPATKVFLIAYQGAAGTRCDLATDGTFKLANGTTGSVFLSLDGVTFETT